MLSIANPPYWNTASVFNYPVSAGKESEMDPLLDASTLVYVVMALAIAVLIAVSALIEAAWKRYSAKSQRSQITDRQN